MLPQSRSYVILLPGSYIVCRKCSPNPGATLYYFLDHTLSVGSAPPIQEHTLYYFQDHRLSVGSAPPIQEHTLYYFLDHRLSVGSAPPIQEHTLYYFQYFHHIIIRVFCSTITILLNPVVGGLINLCSTKTGGLQGYNGQRC